MLLCRGGSGGLVLLSPYEPGPQPLVDPGVGPTKEAAFSDILLLFCAISATEGEQ